MSRTLFLIFGLFWSALTCSFLGIVIYGAINQCRAMSFASTQGVVDTIKTTADSDSDGTTYGVKIAYHYDVAGRRYTGDRLRFMQTASSDSWASEMAHRFAAGTHPTIYYNPGRPAEAVLIRGIQGEDLMLALFLTPFTAVMLFLWAAIVKSFRKTRPLTGLRVFEEGNITRLRPSRWSAVEALVMAIGVAAFISMFVVLIFLGGFHPSLQVIGTVWCLVLTLAAFAGGRVWLNIQSGAKDITFNIFAKTLGIPSGLIVPYAAINQINVLRKMRRTENGTTDSYEVWLEYRKGSDSHRRELHCGSEKKDDAWEFAEWIAEKTGAPVRGVSGSQAESLTSQ